VTSCWLALLPGAGPCDGQLRKCHLIKRQVISREVYSAMLRDGFDRTTANQAARLAAWDDRAWVWGCGGPTGIGGHHGRLDHSRTLRIPYAMLPGALLEFAGHYDLMWYLDREYNNEGGTT
jgi:hypothetical protein